MSNLSIARYFPFARVKVMSQNVHLDCEPAGTVIRLVPDERFRPICHECGRPGTVHAAGLRRILRDLAFGPAQTYLDVEYRRVWCPSCGKARVEQLSFADPSRRVTHRLARYVYELCRILTIQDVARHTDLDPKTVKAIDQHFLAQDFGRTDYEGLRILAIDEISLTHGQNGYMTVVLDYETGRVVWMGEGRKAETLDAFFNGMTPEQKQGIEAVALDMWEAFIKAVQTHCPQAKIVFDLFHLVKGYGEVIDAVRRQEYARVDPNERAFIKGSRYLLLSNRVNLRPDQTVRLDDLLAANRRLNAVYQEFPQNLSDRCRKCWWLQSLRILGCGKGDPDVRYPQTWPGFGESPEDHPWKTIAALRGKSSVRSPNSPGG